MQMLRKLRKDKHMTRFELALALRVSVNSIQLWESGTIYPNRSNQEKLNEYFGCDVKIGKEIDE